MTNWRDRAKRLKKELERDAAYRCDKLVDEQSDLSDEERRQLSKGCKVKAFRDLDDIKESCELQITPKWVLKGRRVEHCMTREAAEHDDPLEAWVQQRAAQLRIHRVDPSVTRDIQPHEDSAEGNLTDILQKILEDMGLVHTTSRRQKLLGTNVNEGVEGDEPREDPKPRQERRPLPRSAPSNPQLEDMLAESPFQAAPSQISDHALEVPDPPSDAADAVPAGASQVRTYKVGLRVPDTLLTDFNAQVRKLQVLTFLEKRLTGKFSAKQQRRITQHVSKYPNPQARRFEEFKGFLNLQHARAAVITGYHSIFKGFEQLPLPQIQAELRQVRRSITRYKGQAPQLNTPGFQKRDVPQFINSAAPHPVEISLHDYQCLANRSFKLICTHLNHFAVTNITQLPTDRNQLVQRAQKRPGIKMSASQLRAHPYKAASVVLKTGGNLDQMALEQMTAMLAVHHDMEGKVQTIHSYLFPPNPKATNFADVVPILLTFYSVPQHFRNYIARTWNVEHQWVRNTLVGWRRKMDPHLPPQFQIEALTGLMDALAAHCRTYSQSEAELRVIGILQRKHLLHVFHAPAPDLSFLLPSHLRTPYQQLRALVPPYPASLRAQIAARTTSIPPAVFNRMVIQLEKDVQATLGQLTPGSPAHQRTQTFLKKLGLLRQLVSKFQFFFESYLPGNRYTSAIAKWFTQLKEVKKLRITRLFTALRGVVALAFAHLFPAATDQLKSALTPKTCVTLPYTSKKRKKKHLPANLIFNKYVIERQSYPGQTRQNAQGDVVKDYLSNTDATAILRQGDPIWLGLPIYSPNQLVNGSLQGNKKGTFWFQLFASPKIRECLQRGAWVRAIRLNVPRGPTNKIVADVTLEATDPRAFLHRDQFLTAWDKQFAGVPIPKGKYVGSDFNPIGKYAITVATAAQEIDLTAGPNLMQQFEAAHARLEKIRKQEIPNISHKLQTGRGTQAKRGRWKAQVTLLHQRSQRIMETMKKRLSLMLYLYVLHRTDAEFAAWDGIAGISTRGTRGTLATAVTYMPKARELFTLFGEWAADLQAQGWLPHFKEVKVMPPHASSICAECLATTKTVRKSRAKNISYHTFQCTVCGYQGNRHSTSARVAALLLQNQIQTPPVASIDGLG